MKTIMRVMGLVISMTSFLLAQGSLNVSRYLEFKEALPGKILKVRKELNPSSGKVEIKTTLDGVEASLDLMSLEKRESEIKRAKMGSLSEELIERLGSMGPSQKITVAVYLKHPPISYPDKTKHSLEELRAASVSFAALPPVGNLDPLAMRNGILNMQIRDQGIAVCEVTKSQLEALKFDADVGAVEQMHKESRLGPDLSTLAASAYNPGSVPAGSGSGVRAATFESGLTTGFLSCIGVTPAAYDANVSKIPEDIRHANGTFRCLTATAPSASFYHRRTPTFDGANDVNYLIDNGIQTVSMSISRGTTSPYHSTYAEFLVMDDFAYRYPYPVFVNPAGNSGYQYEVNWQGYNAISVGNVRHTNNSTYELAGCTQTKNPPPVYGSCISGSGADCAGDREMPHIVVPGIPYTGSDFATTCLEGGGSLGCGTSWSAPVGNGIAADVISADSRLAIWPEKVRAVMVLTAQNVDGGDWGTSTDERDGSGVVSGSEAVSFAQNHTSVSPGNTAVVSGMAASSLYSTDFTGSDKQFNYLVPNPKPAGKHLRVVVTWDSNPIVGGGANALSDLDVTVHVPGGSFGSYSWDSNVEVVDVAASYLTAGGSNTIDLDPVFNRIPTSGARTSFFYYAIAWDWVKDHAD